MNQSTISQLEQLLADQPPQSPETWITFLPRAARLDALGHPDQLAVAIKFLTTFAIDPLPLLKSRFLDAAWELEHWSGADLALTVIEAQDYHCLAASKQAGVFDTNHFQSLWRSWSEEAEDCYWRLDDEAADTLERFAASYPVPSDQLLAIVESPTSSTFRWIVAATTPDLERINLHADHDRKVDDPKPLALPMAASDGLVPDKLQRHFAEMHRGEGSVDGQRFSIRSYLDDDWMVKVSIRFDDDWRERITAVHFGPRSLSITDTHDDEQTWSTNIKSLGNRTRIIDHRIGLTLASGKRILV